MHPTSNPTLQLPSILLDLVLHAGRAREVTPRSRLHSRSYLLAWKRKARGSLSQLEYGLQPAWTRAVWPRRTLKAAYGG